MTATGKPYINLLDALIRSAASGATFDTANNIAAAGDATIPLGSGASHAPDWHGRYVQNLERQKQQDALAQSQHGAAWQAGNFGGMGINPIFNLIPPALGNLGLISNVPLMFAQDAATPKPERPTDGLFGPHGWLSHFGGY